MPPEFAAAAHEVREFLVTWLVLMTLGSLPGLVIVGIAFGMRYAFAH